MRLLVNFMQRETWSVHCLAADCKTPISPYVDVDSEPTLRRLRYAGATDSAIAKYDSNLRCWGRGSLWIDNVTVGGAKLLKLTRC